MYFLKSLATGHHESTSQDRADVVAAQPNLGYRKQFRQMRGFYLGKIFKLYLAKIHVRKVLCNLQNKKVPISRKKPLNNETEFARKNFEAVFSENWRKFT
jgi:hypothetical protein